jgi:SAM-dependent methyltransferase
MGLDVATLEILLTARSTGASFDDVLTVGRQSLRASSAEVRSALARHGLGLSTRQAKALVTEENGYCEPLLRLMGAKRVESIDISDYEGASIVHDMNERLPESYRGRFTIVIDGGSLEHVFNFPVALRNCMDAVAPGGHFIGITPSNNLMGHGFYQFSPELFFRVFTPANGFRIEKVLIYECPWRSVWYEVLDPQEARRRVDLTNRRPAYLIVWAQKTGAVPIFNQWPQQSDYAEMWERSAAGGIAHAGCVPRWYRSFLLRYAPGWMSRMYRTIRPFRSELFKKVRVTNRSEALTAGEVSQPAS